MAEDRSVYRKNFSLIISFLILITITLVIAVFISYNLTQRYVENEFASKKVDIQEDVIKRYVDFLQTRVPEITFYQGFMDSAMAKGYSGRIFHDYPFVNHITFYKVQIGERRRAQPENTRLDISMRDIYQYSLRKGHIVITHHAATAQEDLDFKVMANNLDNYVAVADTTREPTQREIFRTFYDIKPGKISYVNIPRRQEIRQYRDIQLKGGVTSYFSQDMMTFYLDPYSLVIHNLHPELYKSVTLQPFVYDPIDNDSHILSTEIALPGTFSNYKLYFRSTVDHLDREIKRRFLPIGATILMLYLLLVLIAWLIYRNINVNVKLFKLQYDFINNFTHEFKTPVSVIKIAGSNLRSDAELTERQRKHYGKILDEEADKLNELMNKLLSFTQLENRSIKLKRGPVQVKDFVKGYIDTFKLRYPDFKLHYTVQDVDVFFTDPVMLGSIFQNMMENAYKYSAPKRKELNINIYREKRNIIFSFADKGIGIPKSEINNIFKKFYRIQNQYNQNGSVGLGLAFCKELANFMEGDIVASSKVGEGSEFIVTLPYEN